MICEKCKNNIPDPAKFCPKCGVKVEIAKSNDMIICPKCGTSHPITAKFCKKDGTPLQKITPLVIEIKKPEVTEREIKSEAIVEPKLETPIEVKTEEKPTEEVTEPKVSSEEEPLEKIQEPKKQEDVIICPKCGTENPLTAKFCKKDGTPLKKEITTPVSVRKDIKPEVEVRPVAPKAEVKKETVKKPKRTWVWIAVCGLILIIVGVGSYLYFSGQIIKKPTEITTVPEVSKPPEPKAPEEVEKPTIPQKPETEIVSPTPPSKPTIDIARIEKDLNKTLKNWGLSEVYAKVDKDLTATLKGRVYDPRDKILASNITESFKEIKSVKNEIIVAKIEPPQPPVPPPLETPKIDPAKLEGDINRALRNAGLRGVTAEVNDNLEVTLKGSVGSNYEKDRAFEIAKRFKEVKKIRDVIFVVEQ